MTKAEQDRQGILSIEVGGRILAALAAAPQALPLKTLAVAAGMPDSKAYRYLVSYGRIGLVVQDPRTLRYDFGPLAIGIGFAARGRHDVVRMAENALEEVRDAVDETVGLFVWGARGPTLVRLVESSHPVAMTMRVGSTVPLLSSASGRIFAAFMPRDVVAPALAAELKAGALAADAILSEVRARHLARVRGELLAGVGAVSAPLFDQDGTLKAAVTAIGRSDGMDTAWSGKVAKGLIAFAGRFAGSPAGPGDPPRQASGGGR